MEIYLEKNSSRNVIKIDQGGLTLTMRDQYLNRSLEEDPVLAALLSVHHQLAAITILLKKSFLTS